MIKIVDGVEIALTDVEIAEFNARQPTETQILNEKWQLVRIERDRKLQDTDWRASSDLTLSDDWKTYRQALRDVPTQSDPYNIAWPTEPS